MKEFFQHIERLLAGNDCVVIPGLGGFVLHEVNFTIDETGSVFSPGGKEITFNVRLTFNDGILVQSYQEKYRLTFEQAVEIIREKVAIIHEALNNGHILMVGRLGTLRKNEDGHILFRPDNRNLFCPECYGLTAFVYPTRQQRLDVARKPAKHGKDSKDKGDLAEEKSRIHTLNRPDHAGRTHRASRVSRKKAADASARPSGKLTLSQVLTGLAACLLLLILSKPAGDLEHFKTQEAFLLRDYFMSGIPTTYPDTISLSHSLSLSKESTLYITSGTRPRHTGTSIARRSRSIEQPSLFDDIDSLFGLRLSNSTNDKLLSPDAIDSLFGPTTYVPTSGSSKRSEQTAAGQANSIQDAGSNKTMGRKTYSLIISSHPSKNTATRWLSGRSDSLYKDATIIEGDGRARVSIRSFNNPNEAQNYLRQFRKDHPEHADAWLLPTSI